MRHDNNKNVLFGIQQIHLRMQRLYESYIQLVLAEMIECIQYQDGRVLLFRLIQGVQQRVQSPFDIVYPQFKSQFGCIVPSHAVASDHDSLDVLVCLLEYIKTL